MKTKPIHTLTLRSLAALALGVGSLPLTRAQSPVPPPMKLEVATPQSEAFGLNRIAGKPLRGSNQEEITTITDFLLDPQSGQLLFAVAGSGRGAAGETFRIIPIEALDLSRATEGFTLRLSRSQWDQVGTMTDHELRGRIAINPEHQQRLTRQFSLSGAAANTGTTEVIRASELKGREIRAGNHRLGTIEDVVIDFHNRRAAPMLKASAFGGLEQKYLVPFQQLQLGDQAQGPIATTLNRSDFQQLHPGLSPTGYPSGGFGQNSPAMSAAIAVRQAIDRDQSVQGSVQVIPESRIVLQGSVPSEQKKNEVEQAARQAAPGVRIDSNITVRQW